MPLLAHASLPLGASRVGERVVTTTTSSSLETVTDSPASPSLSTSEGREVGPPALAGVKAASPSNSVRSTAATATGRACTQRYHRRPFPLCTPPSTRLTLRLCLRVGFEIVFVSIGRHVRFKVCWVWCRHGGAILPLRLSCRRCRLRATLCPQGRVRALPSLPARTHTHLPRLPHCCRRCAVALRPQENAKKSNQKDDLQAEGRAASAPTCQGMQLVRLLDEGDAVKVVAPEVLLAQPVDGALDELPPSQGQAKASSLYFLGTKAKRISSRRSS